MSGYDSIVISSQKSGFGWSLFGFIQRSDLDKDSPGDPSFTAKSHRIFLIQSGQNTYFYWTTLLLQRRGWFLASDY